MMIPDLQLQTYQTKDILVGLLLLLVVVVLHFLFSTRPTTTTSRPSTGLWSYCL
jgi:hypothetical protein